MSVPVWPTVNAALNGLSAVFLLVGFVFILRKNVPMHRRCMTSAVCTSTLFLISYLTYHFSQHVLTRFRDPEWFRSIYLVLLLTHTVLAAIIVPLIIITFTRALRQRFDKHKKIARWTWPLWMYVSITGVMIYWLLYIKYPQKG